MRRTTLEDFGDRRSKEQSADGDFPNALPNLGRQTGSTDRQTHTHTRAGSNSVVTPVVASVVLTFTHTDTQKKGFAGQNLTGRARAIFTRAVNLRGFPPGVPTGVGKNEPIK